MSNHQELLQNSIGPQSKEDQSAAEMDRRTKEIKSKLVIKAVRNVRRGYETDEAGRGMYRPEIKLDIHR